MSTPERIRAPRPEDPIVFLDPQVRVPAPISAFEIALVYLGVIAAIIFILVQTVTYVVSQ
jgi:hypothetical protein